MPGAAFLFPYRVSYADCTVGNHVYYGRYLDMLELARGEFFRKLGVTFLQWQERGTLFPVIECRMRYRGAARYDDVLRIGLQVVSAHGVRLNFNSRILREDGALLVEAETFHVCTTLEEKPKRLPPELLQQLQPYLAGA